MSSQIGHHVAKCMQSFISQIDGQRPVANMDMQQMASSYNNMGEDNPSKKETSNNKGDVSQQIMDSHGSRVKKYGIYID